MKTTEIQVIIDGEELCGVFEQNSKGGWFCVELNGIPWNYKDWGHQSQSKTPEEAAQSLWDYACEEE